MNLRLLLPGSPRDPDRVVVVSVDELAQPTVGDVVDALGLPEGSTYVDGRRCERLESALEFVVDGSSISQQAGSPHEFAPEMVRVAVVAGPDAGRAVSLGPGASPVGRDPCGVVVIEDRTVSRHHLEIDATEDRLLVRDLGSVNGSRTGDHWLTAAAAVELDALFHLGATSIRCRRPDGLPRAAAGLTRSGRIALVRPPRQQLRAPQPIAPPPRARGASRRIAIDVVAIAVPVLFAVVLAVMIDPRFALMGLAGPVLALANHFGQRRRARRDDVQREITDRQARTRFRTDVLTARAAHTHDLDARTPDLGGIASRIERDCSHLWERRPAHDDFLALSVGFGSVDWVPTFTGDVRDIDEVAQTLLDEQRVIDDAPIVVDAHHPIGIRGEPDEVLALARALVLQAAALHGPADLRLVVATTQTRCSEWAWTAWLPHTHDPRGDTRLVVSGDAALRETVEQLLAAADGDDVAHTLVIVDDASLVANRATPIRQLLAGLHGATAIVVASPSAPLPSLCHTVIDIATDMVVTVTVPARATISRDVRGAGVRDGTATSLAARMARFVDPEASAATTPLPANVTLLQLLGTNVDSAMITARWVASRDAASFVVPIGVDRDGPLMIDLIHDGPHMLVAGTTGSGKSELLRTLITSLAATVDTRRVNFLLVDYKGGSAFDRCAALPHTVGVVTDLDGRLTARALTCLEAELRRRERALRDAGVDDITEYQRRQVGGTIGPLPRLVVVVDEFAALVAELPQFVDALIDIGQRGRSLGVHIILATQRPSGVVKDALRANTNLRISLRVLDQNDSRDVIGVPAAAQISRRQPGRAIARLGAAELITFQAASVTGRTGRVSGSAVHVVESVTPIAIDEHSPSDLERLVDSIVEAHVDSGHAASWRPWPDPLPTRVTLAAIRGSDKRSIECGIVLGLADAPHEQRQEIARWYPARGPLLVHSLRGGGATTALATIAVAIAHSYPPDRAHLYVLDLGAGDLAALVSLAHCGAYIAGHEPERIARLLRMLSGELLARKASPPEERLGQPVIVVIIDNIAALTLSADAEQHREVMRQLIGDGASVDIHLALSSDRIGALGHAVEGLISQRVLLRMADAADYATMGLRGVDPAQLPPGRGFIAPGGTEIQIALPDEAGLHAAVAAMSSRGMPRSAKRIALLPTVVSLRDLAPPEPVSTQPAGWTVGMLDRTLGPAVLVLEPGDHALIAGPARSGKSSALSLIAHVARRDNAEVHVVASPRSPLLSDRALFPALTLDGLGALVDALIDAPPTRRHVIVVDDADLIDESGHLERLLATRPLHVHIVASARADRLRTAFRHWTVELRVSRIGILLRPDDIDGELLGVRLPRGGTLPAICGRGYLVTERGIEIVQLAMPEAHGRAA